MIAATLPAPIATSTKTASACVAVEATARELEVLKPIGCGLSNGEIAAHSAMSR